MHRPLATRLSISLAAAVLATLAGCGGPRETATTVAQAMATTSPRVYKVIKVYDRVEDAISAPDHDPAITQYIEVQRLDGPGGRELLPYDEWNTGRPPPEAGSRVVIAPADWVKRSPDSAGRPLGGF